jgi:hypothetical protein
MSKAGKGIVVVEKGDLFWVDQGYVAVRDVNAMSAKSKCVVG